MKTVILFMLLGVVCCKFKLDFGDTSIQLLKGRSELHKFLTSNQIKVVYFYLKDVKHIMVFFHELKKSAEFLNLYGVKIGFVNCTDKVSQDVEECKKNGIENSVHTYRSGVPLLSLELETMFDVNSIMSNILQLVMLREVPILQTLTEVEKFLGTMRGKKDVVFGHMKAIGTFDHRVFMEVAYAYMDKLQFIVCTDKKATKLFEQPPRRSGRATSSVWWVWTLQMSEKDNHYHNIRYKGELNLKALVTFTNMTLKPKMFDIPAEGTEHPFSGYDVPIVRFYYDMKTREDVYQKAHALSRFYGGSVAILLLNMDREETKAVSMYRGVIPAVSFQHMAESPEGFLSRNFDSDNIATFVEQNLGAVGGRPDHQAPIEEPDYPEDIRRAHEREVMMEDHSPMEEPREHEERPPFVDHENVEIQDDQVAMAVEKTRKKKMPLELVPAFTDKTFPEALKRSTTAVIILYHPFDVVSMANLRMFGEAADMLGDQTTLTVGRVNCYDWTDVCQAQKITVYPTLRVFQEGKQVWDYRGPQDTKAIFSTLKLLELPAPLYESDSKNLMKFSSGKGDYPDIDITVIGLFNKENKKEVEIFQQVAQQIQAKDRILFVFSDAQDTFHIAEMYKCRVPCVVLSRWVDSVEPYTSFDGTFTVGNLLQFVRDNKLPKLTVLTPLMLPSVREKFSELIILFTDGTEACQPSEDVVREIVKSQKFNNVSFNMMPVPDEASVGFRVLKKYADEPKVPHLSYVRFQKGEVFNFGMDELEKDAVTQWLSDIVQGDTQPSAMLQQGEWKPLNRGYEYLKIMDWEKEQARKKSMKNKHSSSDTATVPDEVPEESHMEGERPPAMEDVDDADTRKELFDLHHSRLYHHAPGRAGHHGDHDHPGRTGHHDNQERTNKRDTAMPDDGYSSVSEHRDMHIKPGKPKVTKDPSQKPNREEKVHDPSEL